MSEPVNYHCPYCENTNLRSTGHVYWDAEKQEWHLSGITNDPWVCEDCGKCFEEAVEKPMNKTIINKNNFLTNVMLNGGAVKYRTPGNSWDAGAYRVKYVGKYAVFLEDIKDRSERSLTIELYDWEDLGKGGPYPN